MSTAELLRKAATALDEGDDPFGGSFLAAHDVSFDECMTLALNLATGARIIAYAISHPSSEEATAMMMTMARGG